MTIYCIVCKKEPSPRDSSRSFHKFPDNEQLKERWMKAVGVSSVTKHTKICSDHFDTNDFHDTDGYTRVRRLLSTAVPFNKNKVLSNITNVTSTCMITQDQEQLVQHVSNISSEGQKKSKMSDLSMHPDTVINDSTSDLRNSHMTQDLQEQDITSIQNHSKESKSNENHKRNQPPIDVSDIPPSKTFRFVDGCQPTHLSREDFTSDDAWTRFLKYTVFKNRQIDVFRKRNQRRDYKIGNINQLITKLREENATNAADYLQVI